MVLIAGVVAILAAEHGASQVPQLSDAVIE
jgi:hypothetical protein